MKLLGLFFIIIAFVMGLKNWRETREKKRMEREEAREFYKMFPGSPEDELKARKRLESRSWKHLANDDKE